MDINLADLEKRIVDAEHKELDDYERGRDDAPVLYRASGNAVRTHGGDGPMTFVANEETPDRSGDVILASAWDLGNFHTNPVMPWAHDYRSLTIGHWENTHVNGKQLLADAHFDKDEFSARVKSKFESKFHNASSRPLEAVYVFPLSADATVRDFALWINGKRTKAELLEISPVPVPMHPMALRKAMTQLEEVKTYFFMPGDKMGEFKAVPPRAEETPDDPTEEKDTDMDDDPKILVVAVTDGDHTFTGMGDISYELEQTDKGQQIKWICNHPNHEEKAGAVLSKANLGHLESAKESIERVMDSAKADEPEDEPEKDIEDDEPSIYERMASMVRDFRASETEEKEDA